MPPRIGLQLYTLRDAIAADLRGTLERVAAIGYRGVETAFFGVVLPLNAPELLRDLGLDVFAAHTNLPFGHDAAPALRAAEALGSPRLVWHGWPRDDAYDNRDGVMRLAERFNEAGQNVAAEGRQFLIHNHWWECEPLPETGRPALELLLAELDPAIGFEFDAYWAAFAGVDPIATIADLGHRMGLLHLKDGPILRHDSMCALGSGRMNLAEILTAAGDSPAWTVVELDEVDGDPWSAIAASLAWLTGRQSSPLPS
ncbi:MAG: sugar phosphate isomerase/epimerase family protein [Thermomicrobiales bacterium]